MKTNELIDGILILNRKLKRLKKEQKNLKRKEVGSENEKKNKMELDKIINNILAFLNDPNFIEIKKFTEGFDSFLSDDIQLEKLIKKTKKFINNQV